MNFFEASPQIAGTITAALIQRMPPGSPVTPEDAAKLYWVVKEALQAAAPPSPAPKSGIYG